MNRIKAAVVMSSATNDEAMTNVRIKSMLDDRVLAKTSRMIKTPDTMYIFYAWDWETPDEEAWHLLMHFLETRKHAIITIDEDGNIWKDVETCDADGSDDIFEEILGWKAEICLWQDPSQTIV